ncbi:MULTISPECIES: hypothetical protein [unclassified Streptomyces]|uniref:hypothetical protein n=1 Tax=unclassified Streptomyces TaxID=2593676 RepID=UPI0016607B57|nr:MULTISPECIES: hypothetical protein [unclassified Streptomyces]MBD0710929.1 hypothetical protein [Streptomyces sp. CBMA291]MBD0717348.1 hypothetical protein [Streptomyces sp. CBMA370]
MNRDVTGDPAAAARHERFGRLPERIRFEDMTEEQETGPNSGVPETYDPEGTWNHLPFLGLGLVL